MLMEMTKNSNEVQWLFEHLSIFKMNSKLKVFKFNIYKKSQRRSYAFTTYYRAYIKMRKEEVREEKGTGW